MMFDSNTPPRVITVDDVPDHLRGYISTPDGGCGWTWFHHPAAILNLPTMLPVPLADYVAAKVAGIEEARQAGNWESYVFRHERPYRFNALMSICDHFVDELDTKRGQVRFWRLAADVWTDGEADEQDPCWEWVMEAPVPLQEAMTTSADRRRLRSMAATTGGFVDVWRGIQAQDADTALSNALGGWQWTLSRDVAAWFAWRWLQGHDTPLKPFVARTCVPVDMVAALLSDRGEEEILIDPRDMDGGPYGVVIEPAGPFRGHYSRRKDKSE
jgi:hypothetical protein